MDQQRFTRHAAAEQLTPGTEALWRALSEGRSLHASQSAGVRIRDDLTERAWVFCESSGSTGAPKVIRRSPASWIASFHVSQRLFGIGPGARCAVLGNLGHSLSLYAAVEALHLGAGLALLSDHRPDAQATALRTLEITHVYATPSQLRLLIAANNGLFPTLSHVICGGGTLTADVRADLEQCSPNATITEFFGASETSFVALSRSDTPPGAVGRAYPGVDLQVRPFGPGEDVGEIWVKSPYLFDGYEAGDSADTKWDNGFVGFGELGRLDADGNLYLLGRRSRMVTVADHNVYPEAIETMLLAQTGVRAAAAFALPDPLRGHRIVAAVEGTARAADLRMACRAALGQHASPKEIRMVHALPMLPAGKPDLQKICKLWDEGLL